MQPRWPILLLLIAGVLLLWIFRGGDDNGQSAAPEGPGMAAAEEVKPPSELVAPEIKRTRNEAGIAEDSLDVKAIGHIEDPLEAQPLASSGLTLTGVVLFADDRAPAAGVSFVLRYDGGYQVIHADATGRFRSEAGVTPGRVSLMHRKTAAQGIYQGRHRFAPAAVSVIGQPGTEVAVELTLQRPEAQLLVRVVHLDGSPAEGAQVEFEVQRETRSGAHVPEAEPVFDHYVDVSPTQADGLTSFALYDLERTRALGLQARLEPTAANPELTVSRHHTMEIPLRAELLTSPVVLVLDLAGSIRVEVLTPNGQPLGGQKVWVGSADDLLAAGLGPLRTTDQQGQVLLEGLVPRDYRVGLLGDPSAVMREVTVDAGVEHPIVFTGSGGVQQLAVSGRVIDEEGQTLPGVQIQVTYGYREGSGVESMTSSSDAEGRFAFHATPADGLTVSSSRDIFGDVYEPVALDLPFGTTDVVFQRRSSYPVGELLFEVVDAQSRERLQDVLVMTYRAPHRNSYAFHRPTNGLAAPRCSAHPQTSFVVEVLGYRRATFLRSELLNQAPVEGIRQVKLDRGLLRRLHIAGEDAEGATIPIAGARLFVGTKAIGRSDSNGELLLDVYAWPQSSLRVEAAGFEGATWDPADDRADLEPAFIWLTRE
ncbi:MAG: hypothetical protein ACI9K5_004022 [Gammaproteobacteria bacterium]|jgi:hypothetical protein